MRCMPIAFRQPKHRGHADGEWSKKNHGSPSRTSDEEERFMKIRMVSLLVFATLILAFAFLG